MILQGAATTAPATNSVSSCFSGTETVTFLSGITKPISEVRIGDQVLTSDTAGKISFSEVIFVPHGTNEESAEFAHIFTVNGRDVKMTQNHILPAGSCGSSLPLVYASQVSAGDCILTVSGEERVSKVEIMSSKGVYTIVTNEEFIVVNGIVASSFGANHMLANLYYNFHRFIYASAPALLSLTFFHRLNEVSTVIYITEFERRCIYILFHLIIYLIIYLNLKTIKHNLLASTGSHGSTFRASEIKCKLLMSEVYSSSEIRWSHRQ